MASFNRVQIIGNLGKQAELKYVPSGKALMEFSVAVQNGYGEKASTDWWDVKMWGERAEKVVQYLDKGTSVFIDGRLEKRSWQDDQGVKHQRTDIVASDIVLLGSKPRDGAEGSANRTPSTNRQPTRNATRQQAPPFGEDEELPF